MTDKPPLSIIHFSDLLCVWAYVAQVRIEEIRNQFGAAVAFDYRFCTVFGDAQGRISKRWGERGGYQAFNRHLREIADGFGHVEINPELWLDTRPVSSAGIHLFLKAVQLWQEESPHHDGATAPSPQERAAWQLRLAFFRDGLDISRLDIQRSVAERLDIPVAALEKYIDNGHAFALLCRDLETEKQYRIEGSPTIVLNDGRQKLYGNIGYGVIEANLQELLKSPDASQASWC